MRKTVETNDATPKRGKTVHLITEGQEVDEFRFKHRFESLAAAIKWLLKASVDAKLVPKGGVIGDKQA